MTGEGCWHFGTKVVPGGKKKPWWVNRWVSHQCQDLAFPFEVGPRVIAAFGRSGGRPLAALRR